MRYAINPMSVPDVFATWLAESGDPRIDHYRVRSFDGRFERQYTVTLEGDDLRMDGFMALLKEINGGVGMAVYLPGPPYVADDGVTERYVLVCGAVVETPVPPEYASIISKAYAFHD